MTKRHGKNKNTSHNTDSMTKNKDAADVVAAQEGFLSDNDLKQSQINTVVVRQKDMDRVGFEPTTSARTLILSVVNGKLVRYCSVKT
jgi:hypothetical protein